MDAPNPQATLSALATLPARARVDALREALLCAAPAGVPPFAGALLECALVRTRSRFEQTLARLTGAPDASDVQTAALRALASAWTRLPVEARQAAIVAGENLWEQALAPLWTDPSPSTRAGTAVAAGDAGIAPCAPMCATLLLDASEPVVRAAEASLLAIVFARAHPAWTAHERHSWDRSRFAKDVAEVCTTHAASISPASNASTPSENTAILSALSSACETWPTHRRSSVFACVLFMLTPPTLRALRSAAATNQPAPPVLAMLEDPAHPAHQAFTSHLRTSPLLTATIRACEWLGTSSLAQACAERIERAPSPDAGAAPLEAVLERAHRALVPSVARGARLVSKDDLFALAPALSAASRARVPRLARACGLPAPARDRVLASLLGDADAGVRHACVQPSAGVVPSLSVWDLCLDADARVSTSATLAWLDAWEARTAPSPPHAASDQRAEFMSQLAILERMPHATVRALARHEARFARGAQAAPPTSKAAPESRDAQGVPIALRAAIASSESHLVQQAIATAVRANLAPLLAPELATAANAPDVRVAASAAVALGYALAAAPTPDAARALDACLHHADARVRSNALEAIIKAHRSHALDAPQGQSAASPARATNLPHALLEAKADAHHRVLASALRAELAGWTVAWPAEASAPASSASNSAHTVANTIANLRGLPLAAQYMESKGVADASTDAALDALARMLSDDRVLHRAAGVWAAGRTLLASGPVRWHPRWPELVARVGEVASGDADAHVRARAAWCAGRIERSMEVAYAASSVVQAW